MQVSVQTLRTRRYQARETHGNRIISDSTFIFNERELGRVVTVTADRLLSGLNLASELCKDEPTVKVRAKENTEAL